MRIVFVAGRYWPATGGVETIVHHLARELARSHDVTVLAERIDDGPASRLSDSLQRPPPFVPFRDGDARIVPIVIRGARRLALTPLAAQVAPGLARYAFGRLRIPMMELYSRTVAGLHAPYVNDADVVHAWATSFVGAAAVRAARSAGRPVAVTPFVHRGQWGDDVASRRLLRSVDRVVGLLDVERETFAEFGVAADRMATCGECVPPVAPGGGGAIRARHAITGPLVLFLGVRREYKGYDLLLQAAAPVAAELPDATFAFVGPGPPLPKGAGGSARILDIGAVDDSERAGWLEAADLLCLPSKHEILPASVLEAWSVGTPSVVSDLPSLLELMALSGGGVAVAREPAALARTLVGLLQRPDERRRLAAAGHECWRTTYTPQAVAARHERLYAEMIEEAAHA